LRHGRDGEPAGRQVAGAAVEDRSQEDKLYEKGSAHGSLPGAKSEKDSVLLDFLQQKITAIGAPANPDPGQKVDLMSV
jgi:hypothetical protein